MSRGCSDGPVKGPRCSQGSVDWNGTRSEEANLFWQPGEDQGVLSDGGVGEKTTVLLAWRSAWGTRAISCVPLGFRTGCLCRQFDPVSVISLWLLFSR